MTEIQNRFAAVPTGRLASSALALLGIAYLAVLGAGVAALPEPDAQIPDPWFTLMEILILAMTAPLVLLSAALWGTCAPTVRPIALAGALFMAIAVGLTAVVHVCILTLSRSPRFEGYDAVFGFEWPSVVYAVDILAWDGFFALAVLCLAACVPGEGSPARLARALLTASGVLSLLGWSGVALGDMEWRNLGITGYGVVFPVACAALAVHFGRLSHSEGDVP